MNTLSIIFFILTILMITTTPFFSIRFDNKYTVATIIVSISISAIFFSIGWKLYINDEKYDYIHQEQWPYLKGKVVSGAVYANYTEKVGGLGWVL